MLQFKSVTSPSPKSQNYHLRLVKNKTTNSAKFTVYLRPSDTFEWWSKEALLLFSFGLLLVVVSRNKLCFSASSSIYLEPGHWSVSISIFAFVGFWLQLSPFSIEIRSSIWLTSFCVEVAWMARLALQRAWRAWRALLAMSFRMSLRSPIR